jgi:rubrerythrin
MVFLPQKYGLINMNAIQTEIDAWYLYGKLADNEEDKVLAYVFRQMSEIEWSHAKAFAEANKLDLEDIGNPSWRAKTINAIGRLFGYDYPTFRK